ncbi:MAG: response regulator transcription factor [Bacteroidales bacterium]|nr:response regulator transcription factor [Bacteroidales bacterium]MCD8394337.1 response regulator transcription factor [Bacteroidales bacterium]
MKERRILVVEDDATLREALLLNLDLEGYKAVGTASAEEALGLPLADFDLVLLDVMLEGQSGFALARQMKSEPRTSHVPIIFCTARDNEDDMVRGLTLGADDYIYKPYTLRNVLTRVATVLRRVEAQEEAAHAPAKGISIDKNGRRCLLDGVDAQLVRKELEILELLMEKPGHVFTRDEILDRVWSEETVVLERTVDVHIRRIRSKLGKYGASIVTRPGYGYYYVEQDL